MTGLASRLYALVAVSILATAGQAVAQSAPAAPSNLTATPLSTSSIWLSWVDNQTNPKESGFQIERSPNGSSGWALVGTVGTNVTNFTNTSLTSGVTYWYRVRAMRSSTPSAWSNVASAAPILAATTSTSSTTTTSRPTTTIISSTTSTSTAAPSTTSTTTVSGSTTSTTVPSSQLAPPSNLTATAASTSSIRLNWIDNQGSPQEDGFNVERSPNGSTNWALIGSVGTNGKTFLNGSLTSGVTYYYRVRAKRGTSVSAASNVASAAPTGGTTSTTISSTTTSSTSTTRVTTTSTSTVTSTSFVVTTTSTTSTTNTTIASGGGPALVGFIPSVGTAMGIDVQSGLAVVGSEEFGMSVVNVSNPALPVPVGGADKPFYGLQVARRGNRAVATGQTDTGQARLWVLDVTDTTHPRVQGELATALTQGTGSGFQRVAMTPNGAYAVAAVGNLGLWVIDVSVPSAPVVRGTLATGGIAYGVALNSTGTYAYVAAGTAGLKVVSLANPAAPALVGSALITGRNYRDVAAVGTLVYLANQNGTLDIYDATVPTAPLGLGASALTGFGLRLAAEGTSVAVITGLSTGDQLDVLDVSVPAKPLRRSSVVLGPPGTGQGVALSGGFSFVAAAGEGIRIYDARMTNPPLSGMAETTYLPRNVAVKGTRAVTLGTYLPTNQLRFKVLDVSVTNTPVVRGELATTIAPIGSTGVALTPNANLAVAAMGASGLWVVDVSVPTAPVLRGTLALGGVSWGVALNSTGTHAYVATGTAGLKIVSLANPAAPALVGSSALSGRNYRDVAVVSSLVFLANQNGTLDIFNVANPAAPAAVGATALSGYGLRIAAEGTRVTVITGLSTADQLDVYDVTNPAAPVRRSSLILGVPGTGQGVAQGSGLAFAAAGAGGLRIYDLANPSSPTLRASGLTVGDANGVAVQNAYAYVADYPATVSIVDW